LLSCAFTTSFLKKTTFVATFDSGSLSDLDHLFATNRDSQQDPKPGFTTSDQSCDSNQESQSEFLAIFQPSVRPLSRPTEELGLFKAQA